MKDRVFLVAVRLEVGGIEEILGSPVIFTGVGKISQVLRLLKPVLVELQKRMRQAKGLRATNTNRFKLKK